MTGRPSRTLAVTPQPAGHSVHVEGRKLASPGTIPSSGGRRYEVNFAERFGDPHADITVEPETTPRSQRKSLRFIVPLYLWQVAQSRDAPRTLWHETHHPMTSSFTRRTFFIPATFPWHSAHATPAFTCRLWEK